MLVYGLDRSLTPAMIIVRLNQVYTVSLASFHRASGNEVNGVFLSYHNPIKLT